MTSAYIAAVLVAAFLWAKMETQIEGKDGWAKNLPTWRIETHRLLDLFYGGRPLTGYHAWAFCFVFFVFHLPLIWIGVWSVRSELRVIGSYALFWVIEDVLWFVLNPHFGWKKFNSKQIWWHRRWLLGLPTDYWILAPIGLAFILV